MRVSRMNSMQEPMMKRRIHKEKIRKKIKSCLAGQLLVAFGCLDIKFERP